MNMKTLLCVGRLVAPTLGRCFAAALTLALLPTFAHTQARPAGVGATTAGGNRSTAGVYANLATLGQIGGRAHGGLYVVRAGSFIGSLVGETSEITLGDVTALPTGSLELSPSAAGLRATGFRTPGLDRLWLRADGYVSGSPIHTLRLSLEPVMPGGEGWSLILTAAVCCNCNSNPCEAASGPPPTSAVALALIGQADGSLLLRSLSSEADDDVVAVFLSDGTFAGRRRTTAHSGLRIRGNGRLTAVDLQPDGLMLTFDQPMRLLPADPEVSGERIRWLMVKRRNAQAVLAWASLSGGMLAGDTLVLRDVRSRSPVQPRILTMALFEDGRVQVGAAGEPDAVLSLESSLGLGADAVWSLDGTMAVARDAEVELESDPSATPSRFYRVRAD
jgi:hypothetical protein